jgi:signal peptidase
MKKFINTLENNKAINIISNIIKTILYIILIAILMVIIVQRVSNNNVSIGGIRIFTIITGSMEPVYNVGDILVSKNVSPADLKIGDNITYLGAKGDLEGLVVTHQIVNASHDETGYHFVTKGVNNEIADPKIDANQIYGKVIYKTVLLSFVCKIMNNIVAYFTIFAIVALLVSYQIVRSIYDKDDEDDNNEGTKE